MSARSTRLLPLFLVLPLVLLLTQCAAPTPQVVERVVEKEVTRQVQVEVPKEVVVTKEVPKEVVVTKEVEKEVLVEPDYVTIRTNWLFSGIHAWLFYGREKGYFRELNIVPEILEGNGSGNVVRTVINKSDDFALVATGNPIVSIGQDAPIRLIYTWIGAFNWGYMCSQESGVKVAKDLEGKTIVSSPGNAGLNYHPLFVKMAGLDETKMEDLTLVDAGAMVSSVLTAKADCELGGYADHLPLWAKEGKEAVLIRLEDAGVWGPSTGVITHNDLIRDNPDLVKRMVAAMQKSQIECGKDTEGCVAALLNAHPQKDVAAETMALDLSIQDWLGPDQKCPGEFIKENWEAAVNLIRTLPESAIANDTRPVEEIFDAQFVPACP